MADRVRSRSVPRPIIIVSVGSVFFKTSSQPRSDIHLGGRQPPKKPVSPFFRKQADRKSKAQRCPEPPQFNRGTKLGAT